MIIPSFALWALLQFYQPAALRHTRDDYSIPGCPITERMTPRCLAHVKNLAGTGAGL